MIGGVTSHMLPHLSGVPHLPVNRPLVLRVTNINFLLTISVHYEAKKVIRIRKRLLITLSILPRSFNNNFLHYFFNEMYEDQSGEFCMDEFCIHVDTGN